MGAFWLAAQPTFSAGAGMGQSVRLKGSIIWARAICQIVTMVDRGRALRDAAPYCDSQKIPTVREVAPPSRRLLLRCLTSVLARPEPALSPAKGCPRHSGRDARATLKCP